MEVKVGHVVLRSVGRSVQFLLNLQQVDESKLLCSSLSVSAVTLHFVSLEAHRALKD